MAAFIGNYGKAWAACVLLVAVLFWLAGDVMVMLIAAVMGAVFLSGAAAALSGRFSISHPIAVVVVTVGLIAAVVGTGFVFAPFISEQVTQLSAKLPSLIASARNALSNTSWGRWLTAYTPDSAALEELGQNILGTVPGVFRTTFGGIFNLALLAILAFYLALDSQRYFEGFLRWFPGRRRSSMEDLLTKMGASLRGWLLAQMISMSLLGILTFVGLSMIGIPLAFLLALLTAILTFIPNLGPILSITPPILLALAQDPILAIWVIALYAGLQFLEGNIITPIVLRKVIDMPPAILLSVQLLLAAFVGFWGLVLAAPLTAVGTVLMEEIHLKRMDRDSRDDAAGATDMATMDGGTAKEPSTAETA